MKQLVVALFFAYSAFGTADAQQIATSASRGAVPYAQGPAAERAHVIAAVAMFRMTAFGDSAKITFCNAAQEVGDSSALGDVFRKYYGSYALFQFGGPCDRPVGKSRVPDEVHRVSRVVIFDSLHVAQLEATAFLTLRDREHSHREIVVVTRVAPLSAAWNVVEATIGAILQLHLERRLGNTPAWPRY